MTTGKGSWYSQFKGKYTWVDDGDTPGSNALGVPDNAQGISFYNHATLGHWFKVTAPNGKTSTEQQTEIGPAPWTGRGIDISAACAERMGYSPENFPTDAQWSWEACPPPVGLEDFTPQKQATTYRALRKALSAPKPVVRMPVPGVPVSATTVLAHSPAERIRDSYLDRGFPIDEGVKRYNILYIEGCDKPNLTPNANRGNAFDSVRILWQLIGNNPSIVGMWDATTHAGSYYERYHLLNSGGAFHIALGPQEAWKRGIYHGPALRQELPLHGTRDYKHDYLREGSAIFEDVGCHHHYGGDQPKGDIGAWAAGCQVARLISGHADFMHHIDQDERGENHLWRSTVIPVTWLLS